MKKNSRVSIADVLLLAVLVSQLALYTFMWFRFLDDPTLYGTDFISFYTAGRIVRQGNLHKLYDLDTQRAIQEPIVGVGTFAGGSNLSQHPPYLAPLLACLAVDDFVLSYILWTIVRIICVAACGILVYRFLRRNAFDVRAAAWISLGCISFFPLFLSILGGQDVVWTLLGLLIWMAGLNLQREVWAGAGLAFATLNPTIAGALSLPLLASRRKAGFWFLVAMAVLGLYSLAMVGFEGVRDFIGLLTLSASGSDYGLNPAVMFNLLGLLLRGFHELTLATARQISWGAILVSLVVTVTLWWNKGKSLRLEHIGLAVIAAIFTSPHLHIHSLTFLLLPALVICVLFKRARRPGLAIALVPGTSLMILVPAFYTSTWLYMLVYLWMLLAVVYFIYNLRKPAEECSTG